MAPPPRKPILGRFVATAQQTKIGPASTDRNVAQPSNIPEAKTGAGETRSKFYTFFTKAPQVGGQTPVLYTGDRLWAKVKLILETAGPVSVGDSSRLSPVLGGNGRLLTTGEETEFIIAKGTKLYILATGINRVGVKIEPLPWLEQITATIGMIANSIVSAVRQK